MPLVVPQATLVRLIWTKGGQPYAVNVLGTRKTGATIIDQALANTVGANIKAAAASTQFNNNLAAEVALATVGVRDISSASNPEFLDTGAPVAGNAASGILLPPQVALCVTLRTARAGKSYRGRVYLPGFGALTNIAGGVVSGTTVTQCQSFIDLLRTGLPATGLSLAVVSRKTSTTELVTAAQVRDNQWDTIRGRATAGI